MHSSRYPSRLFLCAATLGAGMFVSAAAGQDWHAEGPRQFIRKDGWLETMLASRERLMAEEAAEDKLARDAAAGGRGPGGFKKVHKELAPQDKPQKLRLRIAGLNRIHIGAAGPGEVCFAEPYVIGRDGKAVPLPVAKAVRSGNAFSHDGAGRRWKPIQWGEQSYTKGFSLRQTELAIDLDGQAEWLELIYGPREGPQKQPAEIWLDWRPVLGEQQVKEAVRQAIWSTAARAFASGGPPRQQRLEELAGIWWKDWRPGDLSELAGRYAAACGENEQARAAKLADDCRGLTQLEAVRDLFFVQHLCARLDLARKTLALVEQSGARPDVAAELAALEKQLPSAEQGKVSARALYSRACELRRRIVLSHPALDFPELLINKRSSRLPGHMCDQYLGRHSQVGSGLVILSDWKSSPKERVLLKGRLPPGGLIHPDLSFDGKRVLFAFASHGDSRPNHLRGYYIHELSLETGEVRQVTGTPGDLMVG